MKKIYQLSIFPILALILFSCGKTMNAVEYNNQIIGCQTTIVSRITDLGNSFQDSDKNNMEVKYSKAIATIDSGITEMKKLDAYDGSSAFKDAAITQFTFYKQSCEKEFRQIIDLLKKESITEEEQAKIVQIAEEVSDKEKGFDAAFKKAQDDFASKYNITLQ